MKARARLLVLLFVFLPAASQARVFDFKREGFAVFIGGSFGNSNLGNGAYAGSDGYGTTTDLTVQTTASGEAGIVFSGTRINLKLGAEYLMPRSLSTISGSDTSGNQLFTLQSTVSALIPEATLEFFAHQGVNNRAFLGLGYGYAMVSFNNQYTMTATGTSELGVNSYNEQATATGNLYQAYFGWEFLFTDTVTLTIDGGYRYLLVPSLQSTSSVNAISGSEAQGSNLINMDGSNRSLNLGGGFLGLTLRFYL